MLGRCQRTSAVFEEAVSCYRGSLAIYREVGDPALRGYDRRRPPPQSRTESGAAEQPFTADSCTCITRAHSGQMSACRQFREFLWRSFFSVLSQGSVSTAE